jgi:phospholipid/cholesterol/gamma-HCH transport system permease protein
MMVPMIESLPPSLRHSGAFARLTHHPVAWVVAWWHTAYFAAVSVIALFSRATHARANRAYLAYHIHAACAPVLPWYTALTAIVSLILIRIVVVTAQSYGLSQYALDMVVRVLVLELLPFSAAMFVALRVMPPMSDALRRLAGKGRLSGWQSGSRALTREIAPRVLAAISAVLVLAVVSAVVALVLAYVVVYGFSPWGFETYTRLVGQAFFPAVTLLLAVKVLLFSLAVACVPLASALYPPAPGRAGRNGAPPGAARLVAALLMVEMATLVLRYI